MRYYVRSFDGVVDDEETPDSTRGHGEHDEAPSVFRNGNAKRIPAPSSATAAAAATNPQRSRATNQKSSSAAAAMGNLGSYTVSVETLQYQTESVYMHCMQDYAGHQMNDGDLDQSAADEFAPAVPRFNNAARAMPNDNYAVDEQSSAAAADHAKSPPPLSLSALRPVLDEIVNAKADDDAKDQRIEQLEHENRVLWQVTKVVAPPTTTSSTLDSICSSIIIQLVLTGLFLWIVYTYGAGFLGLCTCNSRR